MDWIAFVERLSPLLENADAIEVVMLTMLGWVVWRIRSLDKQINQQKEGERTIRQMVISIDKRTAYIEGQQSRDR